VGSVGCHKGDFLVVLVIEDDIVDASIIGGRCGDLTSASSRAMVAVSWRLLLPYVFLKSRFLLAKQFVGGLSRQRGWSVNRYIVIYNGVCLFQIFGRLIGKSLQFVGLWCGHHLILLLPVVQNVIGQLSRRRRSDHGGDIAGKVLSFLGSKFLWQASSGGKKSGFFGKVSS
jgi:hypothetical protein